MSAIHGNSSLPDQLHSSLNDSLSYNGDSAITVEMEPELYESYRQISCEFPVQKMTDESRSQSLEGQVEEHKRQASEQKRKKELLVKLIQNLLQNKASSKEKMENLESENQKMVQTLEILRQTQEKQDQTIVYLKKQLGESQDQVCRLQQQATILLQRQEDLTQQFTLKNEEQARNQVKYQCYIEDLKQLCSSWKKKYEQLCSQSKQDKESLNSALSGKGREYKQASEELEVLMKKEKSLTEELKRRDQRNEDLVRKCQMFTHRLEAIQLQLKETQKKNELLSEGMEHLTQANLSQELRSSQERKYLLAQVQELKSKQRQPVAAHEIVNKYNKRMQQILKEKRESIEELQVKIASLVDRNKRLESEISDIRMARVPSQAANKTRVIEYLSSFASKMNYRDRNELRQSLVQALAY